ncbi:olfactory receptor 4B13-like [Pseudophryne corroboree]|uniref:olfactory receptor 4B13-like n=1 Tax=Pseudophryne corroboree TaxID=495146 RepID=UPI003081959A
MRGEPLSNCLFLRGYFNEELLKFLLEKPSSTISAPSAHLGVSITSKDYDIIEIEEASVEVQQDEDDTYVLFDVNEDIDDEDVDDVVCLRFYTQSQGNPNFNKKAKMDQAFNVSTLLVLLGLVEMEEFQYMYCALCIIIYLFIMLLSITIVFVVMAEPSLHEPMYILICKLVLNGMFGSSTFLPKLIVDLITSSKTISYGGCITQTLCVSLFAFLEMSTFTLMAYDRYLAVCHPLHYVTLMTNKKVLTLIFGCCVIAFTTLLIAILLTWALPLCGNKINNIFCDNMSLVTLSCSDSSLSKIYSAALVSIYLIVTISVTVFSYLKIFVVCLKISTESRQKAVHTLVTHLLNFSVFLLGVLFVVIRYRLGSIDLPIMVHVLLSVTPAVFPPLLNPLIYGVRTHALKIKIIHHLQITNMGLK